MKTDHLLFGAAYYDEYLPYDRIETDMEMIAKAHMNVIRIAESTWSTWEPQEGVFDFTHLHRMLKAAAAHGIRVIVGTPTYAIPTWLAAKYPDIITVTHAGQEIYGRRQNMDIAHPMYRKHAEKIIRRLMEEAAPYDNIIGFQLDNETKAYDTCSKYAQHLFIEYLKEQFDNDLNKLNHAFGLDYWSNRINAWEDFPDIRGTINASLGAAYQKFQRKLVTDFLAWQSSIVREYVRQDQFITHNFDFEWRNYSFGLQPEVNQWQAGETLDITGFDIYHPSAQDLTGREISFGGAIAYSVKKDNYLILETEAQGNHGWLSYPGQLRLQAFSHLASGSNSVMYWHWHSIHNAIESYWKGILSHNLKENAAYREACLIGADFVRYGTHLVNLKKHNHTAILVNHESLNGLTWFPFSKKDNYNDVVRWIYDALYQLNIECDIVTDSDADLFPQYDLLIIPALYSASESLITSLQNYVNQGGHLLSTFKSVVSDPALKIYADDLPYGLTKCFGMTYDQFTDAVNVGLTDFAFPRNTEAKATDHIMSNNSGQDNTSQYSQDNVVRDWMELLIPDTAVVLARYAHPHWGSYAAITHNNYGKGTATYLGCYCSPDVVKDLFRFLCKEASIELPKQQFPIIRKQGTNDLGRQIIYYFNYSDETHTFTYHNDRGSNAALLLQGNCGTSAGKPLRDGDMITLTGWDFIIIEAEI